MPQETKSAPIPETGASLPSLQGLVTCRDDERALLEALEQAFDYRGDVTLTLTDGSIVSGYIFDRARGAGLADSRLRLMGQASNDKLTVTFDTIEQIEFSGRDTAAGKSFETWIKKYTEKKLAGEEASIHTESLDDESGQ